MLLKSADSRPAIRLMGSHPEVCQDDPRIGLVVVRHAFFCPACAASLDSFGPNPAYIHTDDLSPDSQDCCCNCDPRYDHFGH